MDMCDVCDSEPVKHVVVAPWDPEIPIIRVCDTPGEDGVHHKCLQEYAMTHEMPDATMEFDIFTWNDLSIIRFDD